MSGRRLRVALVVASLRILGGQAVQAQHILHGFRNDPEIDAWLVPINPEPPRPFARLLTIKYVRTLVTQLLYWPLLLRELRKADVVHVFSASYFSFILAPLPALLVARLYGKPVLLNYHSGEAPDHLRRSRLARVMLRRVRHNVVPSPFLKEVFDSFDIPAQVVFNTIELDRFAYRPRDPLRPRLLSTRSLEPMYNLACTLRAFALVQEAHPDATLTVVGTGSQERPLRQLASDLGLRQVEFVGAVPPGEMPRYYAEADVYVQTPRIDNMPLSVLEAFASGIPVISTGIGGVPAILTDGIHGYLAADDDATDVARQVLSVLSDPSEARRRAAAARATCTRYEWPLVRDGWRSAYRSLAGHPRVAPAAAAEGRL